MLQRAHHLSVEQIAARVQAVIVTRGAQGSLIHLGGRVLEIPAAKTAADRGSDGLRRCLPRRPAVRTAARARLAHDRDASLLC